MILSKCIYNIDTYFLKFICEKVYLLDIGIYIYIYLLDMELEYAS